MYVVEGKNREDIIYIDDMMTINLDNMYVNKDFIYVGEFDAIFWT